MPKTLKSKIRVLLIEDNRLLREGITKMLREEPDIKVIASAGNGDAIEKARKLAPDVVLLDIGLRNQNSLKIVESIRKQCSETHVVVMDLVPAHEEIAEFVKAGVAGFILKDATLHDFLHTIRSVAKGTKILPPPMTDSLFTQIVELALQSGKTKKLMSAVKMTKRERDVIGHIATGKSNKEIAGELNISVSTVKSHVHNVLDKLALHSRLELSIFAHAHGLNKKNHLQSPEDSV
ncbi:MAG TPA: response regulator transcription factor [candidate division Zixibacteria bacterium]|nr:response regulator transcription factor [candidate division Zixibacteria bacterium]